jgi:hypothetical protein
VFKTGSAMFCQMWLLFFIVNVLIHVNPEPFVEIHVFDREIRKINMLHIYTPNLDASCSTNIAPIQNTWVEEGEQHYQALII